MPVDAAQTLEGKEGARPTSVGMMVKDRFEHLDKSWAVDLYLIGQFGILAEAVKRLGHILHITKRAVEVEDPVFVLHQQGAVVALDSVGPRAQRRRVRRAECCSWPGIRARFRSG